MSEITTVKLEGQIWAHWYSSDITDFQDFIFHFQLGKIDDYSNKENKKRGYIHIAPYVIEIEIPKNVDLRKQALKGLQKQRTLILSENEVRLNKIDSQIQTLMAIEHKI